LQGVDKLSYADTLAQNFDVMTELYPEFSDAYHYCQSFLAPISPEYARRTNSIHDRAVAAHPDVIFFPFYQAFNYFYYLQQPIRAAEKFYALSGMPNAPPWFGHLAGTLMGRGGNLRAGLTMLQAMFAIEQNEVMQERYRRSIWNFNEALKVQEALDRYRDEYGQDIDNLSDLVPRYLPALPQLDEGFMMVWEPPLLRLDRP
jgi:hypothetical protein